MSGEELRAHLGGEAAGDLAHRRKQREASPLIGDGLVGEGRASRRGEGLGDFGIGREMEIGEQGEVGAKMRELVALGLLDFHDEVA